MDPLGLLTGIILPVFATSTGKGSASKLSWSISLGGQKHTFTWSILKIIYKGKIPITPLAYGPYGDSENSPFGKHLVIKHNFMGWDQMFFMV